MGAAASATATATGESCVVPVVVMVKRATDLRKADWDFGGGAKSDPYVVVRIGPKGTTWAQKAHGVEWKSDVVKEEVAEEEARQPEHLSPNSPLHEATEARGHQPTSNVT